MNTHICDTQESWAEYDARGIFLCYVCDICKKERLSEFRPDVLTDPNYWSSEPIDFDEYDETIQYQYRWRL
jgi:hypothetical protein